MDPELRDLSQRWQFARRAALRSVLPESTGAESHDELLVAALAADAEGAIKAVFDNSLALGAGFARYYGTELPLHALPDTLASLGVPCLLGEWARDEHEPALRLTRAGCPSGALGAGACHFYREAIDGLVLGLTGGILHARHESAGNGGERCVDVFYLDPESDLRFAPIPDEMVGVLEGVLRQAKTFNARADVTFLGLSEGVLYWREGGAHEPGTVSVRSLVERGVQRRFPDLRLREISPRSVLAEHP